MSELITLEEVRSARSRIRERIHRTPLVSSRRLGRELGAPLFLKAECLQKTGSFKVRGALNRLLTAGDDSRGFVTISAGNHAQALAWAATAAGRPSTVVMPATAPRSKVDASREYGAEVVLREDVAEAFQHARDLARERAMTFVHPFEDPEVLAGHGTVALEILEDLPDPDLVVVPVGGGGLISGIAAALAGSRASTRIVGVEPVGAAGMRASLDAGRAVRLPGVSTIADGLAAPMAGALPFEHVRALVEDVVTVTDVEIAQAVGRILAATKLLVEPAGAAAVAALLTGRIPVREGKPVVAVLSGGNVDLDRLAEFLAGRV